MKRLETIHNVLATLKELGKAESYSYYYYLFYLTSTPSEWSVIERGLTIPTIAA